MSRRKRKNKALPPRVKRMKRPARLQSARHWIPTYTGKNLVRGYAKHYGMDHLCAVKELRMLGVEVDERYAEQLRVTAEAKAEARRKRRQARQEALENPILDDPFSGVIFAYIAGQTPAGMPYGIAREETQETPIPSPQNHPRP